MRNFRWARRRPESLSWRVGLGLLALTLASACEADSQLSTSSTLGPAGTSQSSAIAQASAPPFAPTVLLAGDTAPTAPTAPTGSPLQTIVATPAPTAAPASPFAQPASSPTPSPAIGVFLPPAVATPTPRPSADPNCSLGSASEVVPTLVAPGTLFYVKGTGFQGDVAVTIGTMEAEVLRIEAGRLTARVPAAMPVSAASVPVRVTTCDATLQANVTVALADAFSGNVTARDQGLLAAIHPLAVGTTALPGDLDARIPVNTFLCRELAMATRTFTSGFPGGGGVLTEWFALRFTGQIKVPVSGLTQFRLESDDGSRLYLDGNLLIDNDGTHTASSVSAEIQLNEGLHDLRLDYFQGPGSALALQLFWRTAAPGLGYPVAGEVLVPDTAFVVPTTIAR